MNTNSVEFPLFCGKTVSEKEQQLVLEIITRHKGLARTELASTLCELLNWGRPNGKLKTVECRQFLELLHPLTILTLPDKRPRAKQRKPKIKLTHNTVVNASLQGPLKDFRPIILKQLRNDEDRTRWKEFIERYHYLGYSVPFGAHLRYFIYATRPETTVLGCLQFSSPAWRMAARDHWIAWSDARRVKNLQRIINNSRFLILPHVNIKNLASHVLSLATHHVADDWQARYHVKPVLIETRVDTKRFHGGCYRAANWQDVGSTTGRGRQDRQHKRHNAACKRIFLYPLQKNACAQLRDAP